MSIARALLLVTLVPALLAAGAATAQAVPPASDPAATTGRPTAPVRDPAAARPESGPPWAELTPRQQVALAPLAGTWRVLGAARKRKWLALSANYDHMTPAEQALLHSRMSEWAALSPRQRTLARLNFGEAQAVPPGDRKAKWEAYQALPEEEKRRLAAAGAKPPPPTAPAVQPVPQQRLANVPRPGKSDNANPVPGTGNVDPHTLLPHSLPAQP